MTAVAFASPPTAKERANAARLCRAQRAQLGTSTFAQQWGSPASARNAYGKCVSRTAQTLHRNGVNAAQQCRAEQADATFAASHDGKTFEQYYGTNGDLSNAFGNCVSLKRATTNTETQQELLNPAQWCRAQRDSMGDKAFTELYGTNTNKRNAFGKCVSRKAKAQNDADQQATVSAARQCQAERKQMGERAFRSKYRTFGACVSQHAKQG